MTLDLASERMITPQYKQKTYANAQIKIAAWNVHGLANREKEVEKALEKQKINFAAISETKRNKHDGGVEKDRRAAGGIMLYIHESYESAIDHYNIWSERIVSVRLKMKNNHMSVKAVYAPEEGKTELSKEFYESLQKAVQSVNPREDLVIAGDLSSKVGHERISKTFGTNGAAEANKNGKTLIDFCVHHNLRILNTLFPQKDCHKYTWSSRDLQSIIDYVVASEPIAKQCTNTRGSAKITTCYKQPSQEA